MILADNLGVAIGGETVEELLPGRRVVEVREDVLDLIGGRVGGCSLGSHYNCV